MATVASQTNGIPPSAGASTGAATTAAATGTASQSQPSQPAGAAGAAHHGQPVSPTTAAPRPRDVRTLELLLTAQGVTSYEARVPLLLLDLAYRHTASVLSDALHLSADPYTTQAGAKASAAASAHLSAPPGGDAAVAAGAAQLAVASRLGFQFGGAAAAGKEWLLELAAARNRTALPRLAAQDWGLRLPSERFVLNGAAWTLRDAWAGGEESEDGEGEEALFGDAMEGVEGGGGGGGGGGGADDGEEVGGDPVEGGTMDDVFGRQMEDEEMIEE